MAPSLTVSAKEAIDRADWEEVESTSIAAIGWLDADPLTYELAGLEKSEVSALGALGWMLVSFHDSGVYAYPCVLRATYEAVRDAESVGKAFFHLVKNKGNFLKLSPKR